MVETIDIAAEQSAPEVLPDVPPEVELCAANDVSAHLTFIPGSVPHFFLWGKAARDSFLAVLGRPSRIELFDADGQRRSQRGYELPLLDTLRELATLSSTHRSSSQSQVLSASIELWSLAAKLACELITRERMVPVIEVINDITYARNRLAINLLDDMQRADALADAMPLAARAVPLDHADKTIWSARALLQAFFDACADALVRSSYRARRRALKQTSWPHHWLTALTNSDAQIAENFADTPDLLVELREWSRPALEQEQSRPHLCLRLLLPTITNVDAHRQRFALQFAMRSHDTTVCVEASTIYRGNDADTALLGGSARAVEEHLLRDLSLAARVYRPIERALQQARPNSIDLTIEHTWQLLSAGRVALQQAGIETVAPATLSDPQLYRLQLRMRIGSNVTEPSSTQVSYLWEAMLGGHLLNESDIRELLDNSSPMHLYRGNWVAVQRDELIHAQRLLHKRGGSMSMAAALAAVLSHTIKQPGSDMPITVVADGQLAEKLLALQASLASDVTTPIDFNGTLRPYQLRGVAWLERLTQLGLGACLADDMGLGKTVQFIAYLLRRRAAQQRNNDQDTRPVLLICPTSVIGNWQRELAKFAPSLPLITHDGPQRLDEVDQFSGLQPCTIVLTSYALLRRDASLLTAIDWSIVVLDEAQNIKNADSIGSRTARALPSGMRIALTGTPVENRLDELWAISEFLNPGLLGPLATFCREVAIPIERFGREDVAERLKRIVRPLILRRVKSDTSIIQDLPEKQEKQEFCLLTREQALLYQNALEENMLVIEAAEGIERRGHVLKLITALKQICNHPAQYLKEDGPLAQRSGKLERLREMLHEVRASGERALIFTQYREMGSRLVRELSREFGEVLFLHGGVPRLQRDAMVQRFQQSMDRNSGPALFVLSVKAGGTGLNLVAATHVFHYDRWWNPAVEDQATDRAYRIGQTQRVQVHKFLCAGTIEERVNALLESKRDLAASIVGQGEQWIGELNNDQLRELFTLGPSAVMEDEPGDSDELLAEQLEQAQLDHDKVKDVEESSAKPKRKPKRQLKRQGAALVST